MQKERTSFVILSTILIVCQ